MPEQGMSWRDFGFVWMWGAVILAAFLASLAPKLIDAIERGVRGTIFILVFIAIVAVGLLIAGALLSLIPWSAMVIILLVVIAAGVWRNR